jgi:hypothetical protein
MRSGKSPSWPSAPLCLSMKSLSGRMGDRDAQGTTTENVIESRVPFGLVATRVMSSAVYEEIAA